MSSDVELEPGSVAYRVLDLVDRIPPGRVLCYGDIAEYLGLASPRQVGHVLAQHGHEVPWFRVVRADGSPASQDPREHRARLLADGVPMVRGRVDMTRARWEPEDPIS